MGVVKIYLIDAASPSPNMEESVMWLPQLNMKMHSVVSEGKAFTDS